MYIEKIESPGLAHFSYILGSLNEAVVIDPRRDVEYYLELCHEKGFSIKYVFETHRNEDYVIGSLEIANKIDNVEIFHGSELSYEYGKNLIDDQEFTFGECKIKALHTPGHTLGHYSYVAFGEKNWDLPMYVFTGDLLFAGDTGRTDFYGEEKKPKVSGKLYDSIHNKILPLGDDVIMYPAHGSGSVCGSKIEEREPTTLGIEKKLNPMLNLNRDEFIRMKVNEDHEYPDYFRKMEQLNLGNAPMLSSKKFPIPLTPNQVDTYMKKGVHILDIRTPPAYGCAHIKGSLSVWLEGIPSFVGSFLDYKIPIVLILNTAEEIHRVTMYLSRIGYDRVVGYLINGMLSWYSNALEIEKAKMITVQDLKKKIDNNKDFQLIDVRSEYEYLEGHIKGAKHIYVRHIQEKLEEISNNKPIIIHCTVGFRANIVASILLNNGFKDVCVVLGSFMSWKSAGYSIKK